MEPLTIDDLLLLIGQKEALIAQLQRHIRQLDARLPTVELSGEVVPIPPNGTASPVP